MKQVIKKSVAKANNVDNAKAIYTVLVDGNNLLKKALVNKEANESGREYGAVQTFLRMLGNLLLKKDFDYAIVAWDGNNSGVLRYELYPDYKANRDKHYETISNMSDYDRKIWEYQQKVLAYAKNKTKNVKRNETDDEIFQRERYLIQNILENLCIRQYMCENVEGDDIIAYYAKNKLPNEKIIIISEDRDLTQLIKDDVAIWIPSKQTFVTPKNDKEILGKTSKNVVLTKILCGDTSDNIAGIKGLGETTLFKHFPYIKDEETSLERVINDAKRLSEERTKEKKKPLKVLENIVNSVTDGCQGERIYEINKKIIDLSEPLLTREAKEELDESMHAPLDMGGRDIKNIYAIIHENKMHRMMNEQTFSNIFSSYSRIIEQEKKRTKNIL